MPKRGAVWMWNGEGGTAARDTFRRRGGFIRFFPRQQWECTGPYGKRFSGVRIWGTPAVVGMKRSGCTGLSSLGV